MHGLVQNRRSDFRVGEIRVHRERELDQTRALLVEVRSPAGEALYDDIREIPLEVPEVVRHISLDEPEASLEPRDHGVRVDVGARVVDNYRNAQHLVVSHGFRLAIPDEQLQ